MTPLSRRTACALCFGTGIAIGYVTAKFRADQADKQRTEQMVAGLNEMDMRRALEHLGISDAERNRIYDEQMDVIAKEAKKRGITLPPNWPPRRPFDRR